VTIPSGRTAVSVEVADAANGAISGFVVPLSFSGNTFFDQAILLYFEAGASPQVEWFISSGAFPTELNGINLVGYLVNCTVSQCAPIAQ
jgi:hypothetical protein